MALRDVVDNCGDGSRSANPVLRMIDAFTGEKAAFHEKWMAQRAHPSMMREAAPGQFQPQQHYGARPNDLTVDDFARFEEEEMAQHMRMVGREPAWAPRGMDPRMMGPMGGRDGKAMPPHMAMMEHMMSQMDRPIGDTDHKDWDAEYERMLQRPPQASKAEAAMMQMMEHEFRSSSLAPPNVAHHPMRQLPQGPTQRDWAAEFDTDAKFAEFDRVYQERGAGGIPEAWAKDFEEEYGEMMSRREGEEEEDESGPPAELDLRAAKENQRTASQIAATMSISDPKFQSSELFKMMSALSNGDIAFKGDKVVPLPTEQREAMERMTSAAPGGGAEAWIDEFDAEVARREGAGGVWQRDFEAFDPVAAAAAAAAARQQGGQQEDDGTTDPWGRDMDEFDRKFGAAWAESMRQGAVPLGEEEDPIAFEDLTAPRVNTEYTFGENNAFLGDEGAFERGRELFDAGRLTEAVEALEAAVKQKPEHSAAWQLLGAAQAENDRDDLAAVALLKAIQADPDNRDALITLAVSYVNDFHKHRALECLQQWLSSSPHYQHIDASTPLGPDFDRNHQIITNMFIQAARSRPADPDPDVQIALGLLYNLTFEYEKAIDCFKAAAMKRPDDYLVWNKLGATQANAKLSQEAIDAFVRALEIKPSYTRACSNLGISFMALNEYGEATKAFLSALALNPNALHQWDNLRNVFSLMERPDLLKKCNTKDISLFAEEFNF